MRLDEDKLEALRLWGRGLRGAGREEQAAAGRAILMLIEEIERLRLELLRTREQWSRQDPATGVGVEDTARPLAPTLQERLKGALTRDSDSIGNRPETSPEAWIESLRRQR